MTESFEDLHRKAKAQQISLGSTLRIRVGCALCGISSGGLSVFSSIKQEIEKQGIKASIDAVGCIGLCFAEPLIDFQLPNGPRIFFRNVHPRMIPGILNSVISDRINEENSLLGTLGSPELPGVSRIEDSPQWASQVRIATRNCGTINPGNILEYIAGGGYSGLANALHDLSPEDVMKEVASSGLRGRGGAAFPTATKWSFLVRSPGPEKYILVNCEEGDPGAFNDKGILESDPHTVIEGCILSGYTTGASYGYIFVRHGHDGPIRRAKDAIAQAREFGLLGNNILGSGFNFDIEVSLTGESYIAGEETALMESIEGKRAMPRSRPPFPAAIGVFGKPSNINNVKTIAYIPEIIRNGGDWFAGIGYGRSTGTAIICVTGDVNCPGMYELPFGLSLRHIIQRIAGGTRTGRPVKILQTGGPLGGVLGAAGLDITLDFESMAQAGAILGSGGIIVADNASCTVDLARNLVAFCQFESCGKCFPCRLGMTHLVEILERIANNQGKYGDLELMRASGKSMAMGSLCGHGQLGFNPIGSALEYFAEDFRIHMEEQRCPTNSCNGGFHRPTRTRPSVSGEWYAKPAYTQSVD